MIALRCEGSLALPGGHPSPASGAVRVGRFLYLVPDDELWLGVFEDGRPGRRAALLALSGGRRGSGLGILEAGGGIGPTDRSGAGVELVEDPDDAQLAARRFTALLPAGWL